MASTEPRKPDRADRTKQGTEEEKGSNEPAAHANPGKKSDGPAESKTKIIATDTRQQRRTISEINHSYESFANYKQ